MASKPGGQREHKAVLVLPDMGLEEHHIEALKKRFHNEIVESLGGHDELARRAVIVVVVVVVVAADRIE